MDRHEEIHATMAAALSSIDGDRTPLELVEEIPILKAVVDDLAADRVDAARAQGLSWAAIALKLGTTRQAAHKRFGKDANKRRGPRIELRFERAGKQKKK